MDPQLAKKPEIQHLIDLSATARGCLTHEAALLRHRLDLPARLRGSLKQHPSAWLFGSLASGFAASFVWRRKPPVVKKPRSLPITLLGLTLTAVRPLAKIWLGDQLKTWLVSQTLASPASRVPSRTAPTSSTFTSNSF